MCKGQITRQRKTKLSEEKSIIDFVIVCDILKEYFEDMFIDENRVYVLTNYAINKGVIRKRKSDHNLLFARFAIERVKFENKREIFNIHESFS